jgi:hypothetical protein
MHYIVFFSLLFGDGSTDHAMRVVSAADETSARELFWRWALLDGMTDDEVRSVASIAISSVEEAYAASERTKVYAAAV